MILSDTSIKDLISKGILLKEGYLEELVNPSSLDIRLDSNIRKYIINEDKGYLDPFEPNLTDIIPIPEKGIVLQPGKIYLVETYETIKLPDYIGCQVLAKSSLGRLGLDIIIGPAGWIDPGFEGKIVLELRCTEPILIQRYMKIAQLKFETVEGKIEAHYGQRKDSKYQFQKNIQPSLYFRNYSETGFKLKNSKND